MKLHELVKLRTALDESLALTQLECEAQELIARINRAALHNRDPELAVPFAGIAKYYADIAAMISDAPTALTVAKNLIDTKINNVVSTWNQRGYIINGTTASGPSDVKHERNSRVMPITDAVKKLVQSRIDLYSDWHYPGLEIGPGDGAWTNLLVANDPLYVIDLYQEFLDSTSRQFPREYQARLRSYLVDNDTSLAELPQNQIGFAFAWNVFNFLPYTELRQYLIEIYLVLRPGGVALFSYNNCDNHIQAKFAEDGWMAWMPKTTLRSLILELGFEIIEFFEPDETVSWVEIKKPGSKSTIKAHPVLGEIKNHNS